MALTGTNIILRGGYLHDWKAVTIPPVLTSSEHQNSAAAFSHQLSPDIRKGIVLFEGSVLPIKVVLKIKIFLRVGGLTLVGETRYGGDCCSIGYEDAVRTW
jgi:hypothetical protein